MLKTLFRIFVLLLFFTACTTTKYTKIEVMVPGDVSYPPNVQKVVLVNNAAEQYPELGHTSYLIKHYLRTPARKLVDTDTVALDSLGFSCIYNAANHISQQDFFKEVNVHPEHLNHERGYNKEDKLSYNEVIELIKQYDADAVISLDKLTYESKMYVREFYKGVYDDPTLDVNFEAKWRIYYPDRQKKVQQVVVKDTLFWEGHDDGEYITLLPRKDAVSEAIWVAGEESAKKLVPTWEEVNRAYFNGGNTYLNTAEQYFQDGNWKDAADMWEYLYVTGSTVNKARAAFNLAYVSELSGDLQLAVEWINKAKNALNVNMWSETSPDYELIQSYSKILQNRLRDEKKLEKQFEPIE